MRMLLALHIIMNLAWIGSILSVGVLLAKGPGDGKTRGGSARTVYKLLAAPAFGFALLLGLAQLAQDPTFYFKTTHFMHAKLTLAAAAIGLHHALGALAKKMESGERESGPAGALTLGLAACAAGAAMLATLKPM